MMPKKPGAYYRPENMDQALQYLSLPDTIPLAGGTELLAQEAGISLAVVDLQDLGLNQIEGARDSLRIGAMVTLSRLSDYLEKEKSTAAATPLLRKAIQQAGPNTYRNAATLGGVIASRLPDSELLAAMLVLDAVLSLQTPEGVQISLAGYLQPEDRPQGLLTEIIVPWADGKGASERVARTPADYPIVSLTSWQPRGKAPLLAATGLGSRPARLSAVEALLHRDLDEAAIANAAVAAGGANTHPGDFRGDAAYRAEMASVLTRRVLGEL
jgi:carbon-monoxide dehydrogenase medium subunit